MLPKSSYKDPTFYPYRQKIEVNNTDIKIVIFNGIIASYKTHGRLDLFFCSPRQHNSIPKDGVHLSNWFYGLPFCAITLL